MNIYLDPGAVGIAPFLPGGGLGDEAGETVDATIEVLAGENADLDRFSQLAWVLS